MFLSFVMSISFTLIATAFLVRLRVVTSRLNGKRVEAKTKASGGGIAFIIAFYILLVIAYLTSQIEENLFIALFGSGILIAITGFFSDKLVINNKLKLALQLLAIIWGIFWITYPYGNLLMAVLPLPGFNLNWGYFGLILALFSSLWMVRFYKLLDEVEALCASNSIFILLSAAFLSFLLVQNNDSIIYLALGLPLLAFLLFNIPPARILMGEVGSGFIACFLALMALYSANKIGYWSFGILLGLFVANSSIRFMNGLIDKGKLVNNSAYDNANNKVTNEEINHNHIIFYYLKINLFLNFPLAVLAIYFPDKGLYFCIVSWVLCFLFLHFYKAPMVAVSGDEISDKGGKKHEKKVRDKTQKNSKKQLKINKKSVNAKKTKNRSKQNSNKTNKKALKSGTINNDKNADTYKNRSE